METKYGGRDIWQLIAEKIDDPKTFCNFSLVCKMFAEISRLVNPQKKTQFAKFTHHMILSGCPCCGFDEEEGFLLPNGNWHGEYKHFDNDYKITKIIIFENGVELSRKIVSEPDDTSIDT